MGEGWNQGPRWTDSNRIQLWQQNTHTHTHPSHPYTPQGYGHSSHLYLWVTNANYEPLHMLYIHPLSVPLVLCLISISSSHFSPFFLDTCAFTLCLPASDSLTDSSQLSQVEAEDLHLYFFHYLLWAEDHGLTSGNWSSRDAAAQHLLKSSIPLILKYYLNGNSSTYFLPVGKHIVVFSGSIFSPCCSVRLIYIFIQPLYNR